MRRPVPIQGLYGWVRRGRSVVGAAQGAAAPQPHALASHPGVHCKVRACASCLVRFCGAIYLLRGLFEALCMGSHFSLMHVLPDCPTVLGDLFILCMLLHRLQWRSGGWPVRLQGAS